MKCYREGKSNGVKYKVKRRRHGIVSARGKVIAYFGDLKGDFYVSRFAMVMPGVVGAGESIALPDYAKGAREIKHAIKMRSQSHSHVAFTIKGSEAGADTSLFVSLVEGEGSAIPGNLIGKTDTVDVEVDTDTQALVHGQELTIVTEAPSADEIQLYDKDNVRCGDACLADEVLLLILGYDVKIQIV